MFVRFSQVITGGTVNEFFISLRLSAAGEEAPLEGFVMNGLHISEEAPIGESPLNTGEIMNETPASPLQLEKLNEIMLEPSPATAGAAPNSRQRTEAIKYKYRD
jgi:hypothetical protein